MIFWNRFCELCKEKGLTPTQMVKDAGIAVGSVTKWKNGSIPHGNTRKKIAEYFSVSEEELFESSEQKTEHTAESDRQLPDILYRVLDLSDEKQKEVFAFIEFKEMQQKNEQS